MANTVTRMPVQNTSKPPSVADKTKPKKSNLRRRKINPSALRRIRNMLLDSQSSRMRIARLERIKNRAMLMIRSQHEFTPIERHTLTFLHDVSATPQDRLDSGIARNIDDPHMKVEVQLRGVIELAIGQRRMQRSNIVLKPFDVIIANSQRRHPRDKALQREPHLISIR